MLVNVGKNEEHWLKCREIDGIVCCYTVDCWRNSIECYNCEFHVNGMFPGKVSVNNLESIGRVKEV